jgi:hypothetical protein
MENNNLTWWQNLIAAVLSFVFLVAACTFVVVWCWWFFDLPWWAGVAAFFVLCGLGSKAR